MYVCLMFLCIELSRSVLYDLCIYSLIVFLIDSFICLCLYFFISLCMSFVFRFIDFCSSWFVYLLWVMSLFRSLVIYVWLSLLL